MRKYVCTICGFIYDEAVGIPLAGIKPGTKWEELPNDWVCPLCGATKAEFKRMEEEAQSVKKSLPIQENNGDLRKLTTAELSALCSNLARGCEKQYLEEEAKLFGELSEYFKERTPAFENFDIHQLRFLIEKDLNESFDNVNAVAKANDDRGAQRAIVWGEKVTRIIHSILSRYEKEGDAFLENTNIYVCEVCGFIYVGDNPPELCPVCKVPSWKFNKIERS